MLHLLPNYVKFLLLHFTLRFKSQSHFKLCTISTLPFYSLAQGYMLFKIINKFLLLPSIQWYKAPSNSK